jgi:hypothetical protein
MMASRMLARRRLLSLLLLTAALATAAEAQVVPIGPGLYAAPGVMGMRKVTSPWGQSLQYYYIPPVISYGPVYYPGPGGYGYVPYQYRPNPYPRYYYSPRPYVGDLGHLYYPSRQSRSARNEQAGALADPNEQPQTGAAQMPTSEGAGTTAAGRQAKPKTPMPQPAPPNDAKGAQGQDSSAAAQKPDKAAATPGRSKGSIQAPQQTPDGAGTARKKAPRARSRRYR